MSLECEEKIIHVDEKKKKIIPKKTKYSARERCKTSRQTQIIDGHLAKPAQHSWAPNPDGFSVVHLGPASLREHVFCLLA